jgi:parallel beta-helix repeat protein
VIISLPRITHVRTPLTALLAVALALGLTASAGAATYYVDNQSPAASPLGPGTEAQPYNTISAAIAGHRGAGITILVKHGIYREQVQITASGTSDAPFVIKATGPGVVIDGADPMQNETLWTQPGAVAVAGGEANLPPSDRDQDWRPAPQVLDYGWVATSINGQVMQVFVNERRLQPMTGSPTTLPNDAFTWVADQGLYVNVGGDNPGRKGILVGRRNNAFRASGKSWVVIDGFEIRHTEQEGINLQVGCSDIVVANNRIQLANTFGIRAAACTRVTVENNVISDGQYHGIGFTNGSNGCVASKNEVFHNADPVARRAVGIYLFGAPNNIIEANRTWENQDTGVQLDAGSNYCLVYNNRSYRNGDHGYDHLNATNTTHVNDVAYGNYKDGFSIEGTSPGTQIYNCISFDNGLTTGEYDLWVNGPSAVGFQSDHNIFWNSNYQAPFKFVATKFSHLADYQAASGQDAHSLQTNPMLVDPPDGNFIPLASSPAIDAGTSDVANWPVTDEAGNPRCDVVTVPNGGFGPVGFCDIGSDEYVVADQVLVPARQGSIGDRNALPLGNRAAEAAGSLALSTGFPNPCRGPVEFAIDLPQESRVEWAVYDLQGRVIWSEGRNLAAGRSLLRWDGNGASGEPAAVGIYMVQARVDGAQLTRRVVRF